MHPFAGNVVVASETAGLSNAHVAVAHGLFCAGVTHNLQRKELWLYTTSNKLSRNPRHHANEECCFIVFTQISL